MGYPADVATVTLTGLFGAALPTTSIPTGYVEIWPNTVLVDAGTAEIIETSKVTAALDATGAFSVTLMATDDTHITPAGWAYWVREVIDGYPQRVYQIKVPAGGPYRLGALQQLSAPATSPYVLQSQVGQPNGVASLDVNGQVPASQLANASGGGGGGGVPSSTVVSETAYGQASTAGAATTYSRGDHTHGSPGLASTAPTTSAVGDAAAIGTGTTPARADHRHGREAFGSVVAQTSFGASSADGTAATVARSDHVHGTPAAPTVPAPATTVTDETPYGVAKAVGTATSYAREDHTHGSSALAATTPAAETIGVAGAVGTGTTPARSDHVHAMPAAGTPGSSAVGDAAAAGSSANVARADHVHGREAFGAVSAQTSYAAASANGSAATVAHSDHQHGTPPVPFVIPPFGVRGVVAVAVGGARFYNDSGRTLTILSVRTSVGTAPTGASLIVDININGTTIFTTQANRPTIAVSGFTSGKVTNMDVTTIADGQYFTVDVDQVGSTVAGADLDVQIAVV